jgi:hypothetical protein
VGAGPAPAGHEALWVVPRIAEEECGGRTAEEEQQVTFKGFDSYNNKCKIYRQYIDMDKGQSY